MDDVRQYPVEARGEYHVACVLLLDTSSSMAGPSMDYLNQCLVHFKNDIISSLPDYKSKAFDVAIIEFNDEVRVVQNFAPITEMNPPELKARGMTAMGAGMKKALELIEQRKKQYDKEGVPRHRPWIFMITDGGPNDAGFEDVFRELQKLEDEKRVMTWVFGVDGYNEEMLKQVMPWYETIVDGVKYKRQRIFRLKELNFSELF